MNERGHALSDVNVVYEFFIIKVTHVSIGIEWVSNEKSG